MLKSQTGDSSQFCHILGCLTLSGQHNVLAADTLCLLTPPSLIAPENNLDGFLWDILSTFLASKFYEFLIPAPFHSVDGCQCIISRYKDLTS